MRRLFWAVVLLAGSVGLYLLAPHILTIVQGAPTFAVTPSGEYGVAGLQIIAVSNGTTAIPTFYCDFAGVINFSGGRRDPIGTMGTMTISAATTRCNGEVVPGPETFEIAYEITGANEFEFLESGNEAAGPVHGRALNGGDVLLFDGTKRNPIPPVAGSRGSFADYATGVRP